MVKLGKATVDIRANLGPLKRGLAMAKAAVMSVMRGIGSVIGKMYRFAKTALLVFTAAVTYSIVQAAKFEKQLANVSTMLDETTMKMMGEYKRELKSLSKQFGESTATLSGGLYDILSASIDASKAIDVLKVSAKAAVAGMTDTKIAADALTSIINAYRMTAEDAEMISDKLFTTVKRGKTTFPELAGSIGRVASTASIAGMSLDELLATIATLTRAGIKTEEAVTSISGTMRTFLNPTEEAVETAKEFGLELSSNTLKTKGFLGAVKMLNKATTEQIAAIVPNIRAFKAMAASLQNVEALQKDLGLISTESAGKAEEAYSKMAATTSFKFGQIKQSIVSMAQSFGEPLLRPVMKAFAFIKKLLTDAESWFKDNSDRIEKWGNKAVDIFIVVANKLKEWVGMLTGGESQKVFDEIADLGVRAFDRISKFIVSDVYPVVRKIGSEMADAIESALREKHPFAAGVMDVSGAIAGKAVWLMAGASKGIGKAGGYIPTEESRSARVYNREIENAQTLAELREINQGIKGMRRDSGTVR